MKNIRNFCIIAHIDHGKSTLADRLLERTKTIEVTEGQMLDDMDLERERGITIKSHAIQMDYQMDGETYRLNLIDTPGHVDFSYEVSRSIAASEGCLLVVDSTQGVQAQTISNLYMAIEHDLEIIPVLNKCDMPNSMPEEVEDEIIELLGCKREEIIRASGRTGQGVDEILRAVVERIPAPVGDEEGTYVERGARFVGRNEAFVEENDAAHHFAELVGRHFGHQDALRRVLHACCVFLDAESADFAVGAAVGFQAFEGLLPVVQASGCHVQVDVFG